LCPNPQSGTAPLVKHFAALLSALALPLVAAQPPEVPPGFVIETVCEGLDAAVTMDVARDGRVFITEQLGAVRVVQDGRLLGDPFVTLGVNDVWERGVEGVALHPRFPDEPFVYVHYVAKSPCPHHVISRFTAEAPHFNTAKPGSELVMLAGEDQDRIPVKFRGAHQGGAMRFGADGKLYATVGEHTTRDPSQSLDSTFGKILRFSADGTIPADNPFVSKTDGALRAIFATGLRNPFGLAVQPGSGRMFVTDVGQALFEEVNEVRAGANYGWPKAEGLAGHAAEFTKPLHTYGRALGTCIAGGAFVPEKSVLPAEFAGKFIFADFMAGWLRVLDPAKPESSEPFAKRIPNPTDLAFAPDGSLLVLARAAWLQDGKLKRRTGMLMRIRASK
jgi:glucose/arabinose dehydrogenase